LHASLNVLKYFRSEFFILPQGVPRRLPDLSKLKGQSPGDIDMKESTKASSSTTYVLVII
jgi:hypothetical protein